MSSTIRIAIVETSGSGKTTLAQQISMHLEIQHVELDAYRHGPNWTETPNTRFRCHVRQALSTGNWIADGNYSVVRDIIWSKATKLIWLKKRVVYFTNNSRSIPVNTSQPSSVITEVSLKATENLPKLRNATGW